MSESIIQIRVPELDGPRAFQLIGILDAIVAELWIHYGDAIIRDAERDVDRLPELDESADLPF